MPILSDIFEECVDLDVGGGSGYFIRTRDKDYKTASSLAQSKYFTGVHSIAIIIILVLAIIIILALKKWR